MQSQQQADGELVQMFGKVIAIVLLLTLLSILGFRYFASVDKISAQGLRLDHSKLLNVLAMVKGQWLAKGRPSEMRLEWDTSGFQDSEPFIIEGENSEEHTLVKMSHGGWPLLDTADSVGCKQLWRQLLGRELVEQQVVTQLNPEGDVCSYIANNSDRLSYQLSTGRVVFLTKE
ncbi:conserved hypothetical protein [Shewanella sediminis HAW-EB3]|uniref:MSHA biogenesis protein MshF n=1 Tax=Shewanella sediminis (strain HAW-EB3) TaxID=425104 RepID=A8FQN8_SHESH|nr:hypothetical protein [Shewanella sediminis]ABV35161.1 conserved hypothetical protein [Shewanella sediminis HAW-EB3]